MGFRPAVIGFYGIPVGVEGEVLSLFGSNAFDHEEWREGAGTHTTHILDENGERVPGVCLVAYGHAEDSRFALTVPESIKLTKYGDYNDLMSQQQIFQSDRSLTGLYKVCRLHNIPYQPRWYVGLYIV